MLWFDAGEAMTKLPAFTEQQRLFVDGIYRCASAEFSPDVAGRYAELLEFVAHGSSHCERECLCGLDQLLEDLGLDPRAFAARFRDE